jgi:two-component system, cell cycle sensor histidine kinase and response regulator CckA
MAFTGTDDQRAACARSQVIDKNRKPTRLVEVEEQSLDALLPFCLLETLPDAVVAQTVDGIIASWNPAAERLFGYSAQEIKGKPFSILLPTESALELSGLLEQIGRGQRIAGLDTMRVRKDGSRTAVSLTMLPMKDSSDRVVGAIGILRDITPRIKVEAKLWESEEQFRELALHLRQVLWMIDETETKMHYISPAYEKIWGRTCQSVFDNPRSFFDAVHPEDRKRVVSAEARKYQKGRFNEEYRILRPDGSVRWIWDRGYPIQDEQGQTKGFVGIAEDITERKEAEVDRARLAAIVECSEDAIVSKTTDGIVIDWNPGAERLYGYSAEEMIGRPISVLFTADHYQEYLQIMEKVGRGERLPAYETVRRRKDGTVISVSVDICPIEVRDAGVVGASKIAHDITRIKQLEEQFRQSQKMEAVGRLAGGVAHDFNNLLTVICGCSEMLLNGMPPGDSTRNLLVAINKAGERGATLTRQLLMFSRKQVLQPKVLDLNAMVADSEKMLKRLVGEDVDLVAVLDPALGRVKADLGQVEQVLMNLVVNARDAMPEGGKLTLETANAVLDQTYCRSHAEIQPGRYIMLAVSDSGCGMDEQTRTHVFEPFFTTKDPGKGTGLGLAMVYGFTKQSGGHASVYSELGIGSTFKIYLPEVEATPSSGELPASIAKMPHGDETILLVEDEGGVRTLARQILQTCGYTVLEAAHGIEAIRLAEEHQGPVHLLVTDVVMPDMGGRRVAERVAALKPDVKVLYLSGYTDDAVIRHGVLTSQTDFLQKPFTPIMLAQKVREVLGERVGPDVS